MPVDPYTDEAAILAAIRAEFTGYLVVEEILDGDEIPYENGKMVPYLAVDFGMPVASATGRSIAAESKQPTDQRVIVSAVSDDPTFTRQLSGRVARDLVGLEANSNTGPLRLIGGGGYTMPVANGPTQYVRDCYFLYLGNMAS